MIRAGGGHERGERADTPPRAGEGGGGVWWDRVKDPGDNRLSRQRHYHGPDGLDGRVRDGNGYGPAGMVAETSGRRGSPPGGRPSLRLRSHWSSAWTGVGMQPHDARITHRRSLAIRSGLGADPSAPLEARRRIGVVKPLGCWDRSAAAVARRALPAHRPGRLPGAFAAKCCRKPRFGGGFTLRCFQRLSSPDLATLRCR